MLPKANRIWAFVCLLLALQLASAQSFRVVRRQDGAVSTSTVPPTTSARPTVTAKPDGNDDEKKTSASQSASPTKDDPETTAPPTEPAPTTTMDPDNPLDNSTLYNTTIPEGQLPLAPVITPGWGVAGVVMMLTGVVYTLIGIKNRYIHSFFSTAYLAALCITVLIIYVTNLPISNALQGGYVAAIILSGCALGAASIFFKELTEGLGCALGGFCVGMWLLCLVPGGLLQNVTSKAIMISCFAAIGFGFYISRWTREWALITMIAFSGATVIVLGVDCFSRAGLKEFWAYLWDLNENLFPLGANTYPVTKGIRVETAGIIVVCLMGIISQIKLWRIVKQNRKRRAAERAADQRNLEEEEANVGRQIEETNARERQEWERVYGNGSNSTPSETDMDSEKKLRGSHVGSTEKNPKMLEGIEMADMSDTSQPPVGAGLMSAEGAEEGKIMVRVAADDIAEMPAEDHEVNLNEKAASTTANNEGSQQAVAPPPEVVSLPFKVPVEEEEDVKSEGDRSSVATFADEEAAAPAPRKRPSLVKRLSRSSATLLRSFSQRENHTAGERQLDSGGSSDELVEPNPHHYDDDDRSSLAVTVDDESVSGDDRHSIMSPDNRKSIEITAKLGKGEEGKTSDDKETANATEKTEAAETTETTDNAESQSADEPKPADDVNTNTTPYGESKEAAEGAGSKAVDAPTAADGSKSKEGEGVPPATSAETPGEKAQPEPSEKPKSVLSAFSGTASLTKDRLPKSLSKVALSYRTNEWAKHLSNADAPEPEQIHIAPIAQASSSREVPRSVDVEDLQKTAEEGVLPPAMRRSDSQGSHVSSARPVNIVISPSPPLDSPPSRSPGSPPVGLTIRPTSLGMRRTSSGFAPIAEEYDPAVHSPAIAEEAFQQGDGTLSPSPYQEESSPHPAVPGVVPYANPKTLLGQRETVLRNRSQGNLLAVTPESSADVFSHGSDAGSLNNYPMYSAAFNADADDLPLSQRRELMRQSTMTLPGVTPSNSGVESSENTAFNSHQPRRNSGIPTAVAREARLASFRQSVAQDLRTPTPGVESPFASSSNLLGGVDRSVLMEQREAESHRRELQKRHREYQERMFENRMRSGDLIEAHREVMRKMQNSAKD